MSNVLPHSLTLEQAVLASLMSDCDIIEDLLAALTTKEFYDPKHRVIFDAIRELNNRNTSPDALTVSEHLKSTEMHQRAGGDEYLAQILRDSPATSANALAYAGAVRDFAIRRDLIKRAHEVLEVAHNPEGRQLADILDIAETQIMGVRDSMRSDVGAMPVKQVAAKALQTIDDRFHSGGKLPGISTGIPALDDMTLGLERKRLVIIGGRPSQGKTTLAMNIVEHIMTCDDDALKGQAGLVFTMEMDNESIVENMLSSLGRIGNYSLRKGVLEDEDWPRLTVAFGKLTEMSLYLDDRAGLTLQEMRAEARRIKRQHPAGLAFIMVDYLQRMSSTDKHETTSQRVGSFSAGLKRMAKDFDCPVIALAQLNRANQQRNNKRPGLSDLRDSGEIEQDGDLIMFIHRDEYYNPTDENRGKAVIIIAKQRKGRVGDVHLDSKLHFCRFDQSAGQEKKEWER